MTSRSSILALSLVFAGSLPAAGQTASSRITETPLTLSAFFSVWESAPYDNDWPVERRAAELTGISIQNIATEFLPDVPTAAARVVRSGKLPDIIGGAELRPLFNLFGPQGAFVPLDTLIPHSLSDRIDRVVLHPLIGPLLMTAVLSSLILHEKTSRGALMGLVIATVGVVVCNLDGGLGKLSGNLLALLAALLQALYTLCGRKARAELDTNTYTSIVYGFTFAWMAIFVLVSGTPPTGLQPQNLLWALGLAVLATLLGHTMLNVALKYFKAPTVSAVMLVTVVTAPLVVLLVLGDLPTKYTLLGGCIIIVGLLWYLWVEKRDAAAATETKT